MNKASKIKIIVIDPKNNFRLRLPALHFSIISFMASSALLFRPFILNNSPLDDKAMNVIHMIDRKMISEILDEFKSIGPFELIDISTGDGTQVKIYTL